MAVQFGLDNGVSLRFNRGRVTYGVIIDRESFEASGKSLRQIYSSANAMMEEE